MGKRLLSIFMTVCLIFSSFVLSAFGAVEKTDISVFSDVPKDSWYAGEIAKAVAMKSFAGSGALMRPQDPVTRQEAFTVLAKVFKLEDGKADSLDAFKDAADVSSWAIGKLSALYEAGYISGSNGQLKPLAPISRAEFAQIMYNMVQVYISSAGTYTELAEGNVMVNAPGVVFKDMEVKGDVIVGDGVGDGDFTLDNVKINGRLVVRGGGENSIIIRNKTSVGNLIVSKSASGGLRVRTEQGCRVEIIHIDDGKDDVILEGEFNRVVVESDNRILLKDADVTSLSLAAENSNVSLHGNTKVTLAEIEQKAGGSKLNIGKEATVYTQSGFDKALAGDYTDVYLHEGCYAEIKEDTTTAKHIGLDPGCSIGDMPEQDRPTIELNSGTRLENHNTVRVYPIGKIRVMPGANLSGNEPVVDDGGIVEYIN